jgi:hypothetical protein
MKGKGNRIRLIHQFIARFTSIFDEKEGTGTSRGHEFEGINVKFT